MLTMEQPIEGQAPNDELDPAYAQFRDQIRFWIQRVAVPLLMVIGLFGNLITMIIMTRRRMRSTTNMYLAALAFVDMLYLVLTFLLGLSHYPNMAGHNYYTYWRLRPFLMMLTDACSNTSVWLTVSFTIERYIAVKYPMKGKVWCTEARAKMLITCVFVFGILFALPVPFEWKVIEKRVLIQEPGVLATRHSSNVSVSTATATDLEVGADLRPTPSGRNYSHVLALDYTDFGKSETFKTIYYSMTAVIFCFIPLFSLMLFNGFLIKSVHQSKRERTKMTRRVTGHQHHQTPVDANNSVGNVIVTTQQDHSSNGGDGVSKKCSTGQVVDVRVILSDRNDQQPPPEGEHPMKLHIKNIKLILPSARNGHKPATKDLSKQEETPEASAGARLSSAGGGLRSEAKNVPPEDGLVGQEHILSGRDGISTLNDSHDQSSCVNELAVIGTDRGPEMSPGDKRARDSIELSIHRERHVGKSASGSTIATSTIPQPRLSTVSKRSVSSATASCSNLYNSKQQATPMMPASSQERRITIMLIAVVILFLVCQIPSAAMLLYTSVHEMVPNTNEHALVLAFGNIFNFLMAVNAAGNFILYSFLSKKYRRTFVQLFCSCLGATKKASIAQKPPPQANRVINVRFEAPSHFQRSNNTYQNNNKSAGDRGERSDTSV